MFAVIKTGGKQYRVQADAVIRVEKIAGEAGDEVSFDQVLMVGDDKETRVGEPTVDGASVTGTVLEQTRGDKIIVFKKQRRKNYRRRNGHRQELTVVRITDISPAGGAKKKAASKAKTPDEAAQGTEAEAKSAAKAGDDKAKPAAKAKAAAKPKAKPAAKAKDDSKAKPAAKSETAAKPKTKKADDGDKAES